MPHITLEPPKNLLHWMQLYILYRRSFPRAERKPFLTILKKYRVEATDIWCILCEGRFLGFAATMNSPDLVMLDYLAVKKSCRGQGVGSAAMGQLTERYRDRGFLLEIESPYEPGKDQPLRQKRKQFYLNCGMEPLNVMAEVFGVKMELLGRNCQVDFPAYRKFYHDFYRPWAAEHILPAEHPGERKKDP